MIHNIEPKIFYNSYRQAAPDTDSFVLCIKNNAILVKETDEGIEFPRLGELTPPPAACTYLFSINDQKYFLVPEAEPWGTYNYQEKMAIRFKKPKYNVFAAATACQLHNWYECNRFCGRCGAITAHDTKERMLRCGNCGNMIYPKLSPAVIVGVADGDRLLLAKSRSGSYALIAGFSEIGEPVEDTVRREVLEETGVRVKNIRYYKSQPWPFSETLLMGFYCALDGPDTLIVDTTELDGAEWVCREDIDVAYNDVSLTNEMIVNFKEHKE
jgi:NAD+ diphosphatase